MERKGSPDLSASRSKVAVVAQPASVDLRQKVVGEVGGAAAEAVTRATPRRGCDHEFRRFQNDGDRAAASAATICRSRERPRELGKNDCVHEAARLRLASEPSSRAVALSRIVVVAQAQQDIRVEPDHHVPRDRRSFSIIASVIALSMSSCVEGRRAKEASARRAARRCFASAAARCGPIFRPADRSAIWSPGLRPQRLAMLSWHGDLALAGQSSRESCRPSLAPYEPRLLTLVHGKAARKHASRAHTFPITSWRKP